MDRGSRVATKSASGNKCSVGWSGVPGCLKAVTDGAMRTLSHIMVQITTSTSRWSARLPLGCGSWRAEASKGYKRQETEIGERTLEQVKHQIPHDEKVNKECSTSI